MRRHRRLFWRVYRHGLLLLVTIALTLAAVAWLHGAKAPWKQTPQRLAKLIETELSHTEDLPARVRDLAFLLHVDLAIDGPSGRVAQAGEKPPAPLDARERAHLAEHGVTHRRFHREIALPMRLHGQPHYLIVDWRGHRPTGRGFIVVLIVLAALAFVSVPLVRAIVRPLERITETARRLGDGDLAARTGVARKDEVGALAVAVDEMAERIGRLLRSEKELLANVSHELRTPLARMRVALEMIEERPEAAAARVSGLMGDVAELESLIADLLGTARLDLSGEGLHREEVTAAALAEAAEARFAARHPERSLQLRLEAATYALDAALFARVLDNLLDNAARYSDAPHPIELSLAPGLVSVADRGIGVADEDLARLFEPFFRTDRSRARVSGGVGMGLTLCRRIVEAHGGDIEARAREGGGLEVRVELSA